MPVTIRQEVRRMVWDAYLKGVKGEVKIRQELLDKGVPERDIPSARSIYRMCQELGARYSTEQQKLDEHFQISPDLPIGVSEQDFPLLFEIQKRLYQGEDIPVITVRILRWVNVLRPTMLNDGTTWRWLIAYLYANKERWAAIEGEELNTWELDLLVAYAYWRSESNRQAYLAAVACGMAPSIEDVMDGDAKAKFPLDENSGVNLLEDIAKIKEARPPLSEFLSMGEQGAEIQRSLPEELREAWWVYWINLSETQPDLTWQERIEQGQMIADILISNFNKEERQCADT